MNSRERVRTAMERGVPDRVPVWCQLGVEHILRQNPPGAGPIRTIEDFVALECELTRRYCFDGAILYLPATAQGSDVSGWLNACNTIGNAASASHVFAEADPDFWPRPESPGGADAFFACRLAREILGEGYHIGGWTGDGYSNAIHWFPTLEEALLATLQDPGRFSAIVRYFDEACVASALAQVEFGGVDGIHISSPYAGSSFISRDAYAAFVAPSVARIAAALKPTPAFSYVHTCGFIGDRLELLAETGVDGIECMDPAPLGDTNLGEAKARVGQRVFLKGNLDSVNALWRGTDDQVESAVRACLRDGMPGGGYILSTACSVAPAVSPERIRRIAELAEAYGRYE